MRARKFVASTSREVLRQVRHELGPDAVILSNRQSADGVEIMALAGADLSCLMADSGQEVDVRKAGAEPATAAASGAALPPHDRDRVPHAPIADFMAQSIIREIQTMRGLLEEQMATAAWGDTQRREPGKAKTVRALIAAGFSPLLSRMLMDKLPRGCDHEQNLKKARAELTANLRTVTSGEIVDSGGIYALVGPTGVGKTTTTAKLAARCVVRHGADKVALFTTDSYRIGGHEQLRIFGKLLGVPVRAIKDMDDLQLTLSESRNKHMVLIDTVGMGQRDEMVAEQMAMLCNCGCDVKRLLLLNATGNGDTLDDVVRAYQGDGLYGCIVTKVDEAASLGVVLDAVIRHKLVLNYVANGQKVPEDLHLPNAESLLRQAFRPAPEDSPFALEDAEFALMMAGNGGADPRATGVHAGAGHG